MKQFLIVLTFISTLAINAQDKIKFIQLSQDLLQKVKPLVLAGLIVLTCFGSWKVFISIKNTQPISKTTSQITFDNIMNPPDHYYPIRDSFIDAFFFIPHNFLFIYVQTENEICFLLLTNKQTFYVYFMLMKINILFLQQNS